jgi:hypothetical protein
MAMNAALPTYSAENIVREHLNELETNVSFLAALAGIPQSRLSLAFSGTRSLSAEDGTLLTHLTAKLIDLRRAFGIIPLELKNAAKVRALLTAMEKSNVTDIDISTAVEKLFQEHQ